MIEADDDDAAVEVTPRGALSRAAATDAAGGASSDARCASDNDCAGDGWCSPLDGFRCRPPRA